MIYTDDLAALACGIDRLVRFLIHWTRVVDALKTYAPPYEALGVSAAVLREYHRLLAADEPPPDGADEGGLYRALTVELPCAMRPWTLPPGLGGVEAWGGRNLLFLLPLSPYHFCRAAEPALGASWGPPWARAKGVIPVHVQRAMAAATLEGLRSHSLACAAYDRVLRWLFEQPAWRLAPERHVFAHAMVHLPRVARESDDRAPRADGKGVWAEVGRAIVIGAEDRRHDWRAAAVAGRTVLAPLHSRSFLRRPRARPPNCAARPPRSARRPPPSSRRRSRRRTRSSRRRTLAASSATATTSRASPPRGRAPTTAYRTRARSAPRSAPRSAAWRRRAASRCASCRRRGSTRSRPRGSAPSSRASRS
jgi:hypothetical protein